MIGNVLPLNNDAALALLVAEANVLILLLLNGFTISVALSLPLMVLPSGNILYFIIRYGGNNSLILLKVWRFSLEPSKFLCKKAILALVLPN